jgi:hypothetical protein
LKIAKTRLWRAKLSRNTTENHNLQHPHKLQHEFDIGESISQNLSDPKHEPEALSQASGGKEIRAIPF